MTTVIGLDISLTKTGIAVVKADGLVLHSGLIKSKPTGDTPKDEVIRLTGICRQIFEQLDKTLGKSKPDLVMIENFAFMARNTTALTQIAGVSYMIRAELVKRNWPFILVAPTSLKKFVTGKGNADKNQMMMMIFKDYTFESLDDNTADSYALAVCGLALLGKELHKTIEPQREVLKLLKKQL